MLNFLKNLINWVGEQEYLKGKGYTFDAGPTVITAPFLFEELFQLFNKKRDDYVKVR